MSSGKTPKNWYLICFFVLVALAVFLPWFGPGVIGYGDWVHNLPDRIKEYYQHWLIWDGSVQLGTSLGTSAPNNVILYPIAWIMSLLQVWLHLSTSLTTRLFWYFPYIVFSLAGGWYLGWVISERRLAASISAFLYAFSTFGLLTVQGGQMTVGNAYALAPLVLALVIKIKQSKQWSPVLWLSLALWLESIYDIRITYLTILAVVIYLVVDFSWRLDEQASKGFWRRLLSALVLAGLLSAYWVIPMFLTNSIGSAGLPTGSDSVHWLPVLSYATLSNALASNHVWWPWSEGGVLNGIQPLFIVSTLLAIIGLSYWRKRKLALALAGVWVIGVFLAKGVNPPLGEVYRWLFLHFPGFSFFRDPAKFFTLIMLGLAPLAGVGALHLWRLINLRWRSILLAVLIGLLLWPLVPLVAGTRHGTFVTHQVPAFSQELQQWYRENGTGRTLWLPRTQRYIIPTQQTPTVDLQKMIESGWQAFTAGQTGGSDGFERFINHPYANWLLDRVGIKYVGVPVDTDNEIFLNFQPRDKYLGLLRNQSWLQESGDVPGGLNIFVNKGGIKPAIYTAGAVVSVDADSLGATPNDLPTLDDNDVLNLLQSNDLGDMPENERLRFLELIKTQEQWQADFSTWKFNLDKNFSGRLVLDPAFSDYQIMLDGQVVGQKTTSEGLMLDHLNLTSGEHQIKISADQSEVVLPDNYLSSLDWQVCPESADFTTIVFPNESNLTLSTELGHTSACVESPIGNLSPGVYLLQVALQDSLFSQSTVQTLYGLAKNASIIGNLTGQVQNSATVFIVKSNRPARLRIAVGPDRSSNKLSPTGNRTEITNLSIKRLFNTQPAWLKLESDSQDENAPAVVDWQQLSPRQYQATVAASDHPYYLILNQAYESAWNLQGTAILDHRSLNGGLNAWLIMPKQETKVTITYASEVPYVLGAIISLLTLLSIIVWGWSLKKNK